MEIVSTMGSGSLGRELNLDVFVDALQDAVDATLGEDTADESRSLLDLSVNAD